MPDIPAVREIAELQERAARAVPAAVQQHAGGCWLRYTDSAATWWAGAALMHGPEPGRDLARRDLAGRIAVAEDFYAAHGGRARFQVCPACPPALDDALARRGYALGDAVSLQVAASQRIARLVPAPSLRVVLSDQPDPDWFDLLLQAHGSAADPVAQRRLIQRVDRPSAYATVFISDRPAAVGRAVADTGWAGAFDIATMPDARRRGAGRAALAAIADWAISQRCSRMYLQVERDNAGALGLYRRAGFQEACAYHYRTAASVG